jgi:hypothetical protein
MVTGTPYSTSEVEYFGMRRQVNWRFFPLKRPAIAAGSFPQSLGNTNFDAAQQAIASNLRDASLTLINPAMLPSGQFRFDLPTEPGYTYSILFTQSLDGSSSWTPVLTTNATAALLSFTNTLPSSAQAGFYQATHN